MKKLNISEKTTLYISMSTLILIMCATAYVSKEYYIFKNEIKAINLQINQLNDKILLEFARRDFIMLEHGKSRSIQIDKLQQYVISISNNSLKLKQLKEDIKDLEQDIDTLR